MIDTIETFFKNYGPFITGVLGVCGFLLAVFNAYRGRRHEKPVLSLRRYRDYKLQATHWNLYISNEGSVPFTIRTIGFAVTPSFHLYGKGFAAHLLLKLDRLFFKIKEDDIERVLFDAAGSEVQYAVPVGGMVPFVSPNPYSLNKYNAMVVVTSSGKVYDKEFKVNVLTARLWLNILEQYLKQNQTTRLYFHAFDESGLSLKAFEQTQFSMDPFDIFYGGSIIADSREVPTLLLLADRLIGQFPSIFDLVVHPLKSDDTNGISRLTLFWSPEVLDACLSKRPIAALHALAASWGIKLSEPYCYYTDQLLPLRLFKMQLVKEIKLLKHSRYKADRLRYNLGLPRATRRTTKDDTQQTKEPD